MISLSVCACGMSDSNMDIYEKIHNHYNKMKSYSADLDLTVYSNKTENRYFITQKTILPNKFYNRATDEKGTFSVITVSDGTTTKTQANGSDYSITVPAEDYLNILFVNNFLKAYYASEETSLSVDNSLTKSDKTVFTVSLENPDITASKVSMSFNNKTLSPDTVTVYGKDGKTLATAKYENFKYNDKIDESVFNTD